MKRICSVLLVLALMLSMLSMLGVQSFAAALDTAYMQSCTNEFINFIKTAKGRIKTADYYLFHEKAYASGSLDIKTDFYYYPSANFIVIKSLMTYENGNVTEKRNISFTIPGKYTGYLPIDYDYSDTNAKTLQAQAKKVNMTTYDGTNASFAKTGGNSSDSQKNVNWWVNYALVTADNLAYLNGRTTYGVYSMGFCGMCDQEGRIPRTVRATLTANGEDNRIICGFCGKIIKPGKVIPRVQSVALSQTAMYYTGKVKTPTVTVKDTKGKTLKLNTDYSITYASGRKAIGKYAVKVTFKGNYSGSKTLYFTINPGKPQISKITAGKKALALKWGKVNLVSGYQIQYATNSSFTSAKSVTAKGAVTVSKTLSSLTSGKRYYVRMRSYKATTYGGEKLYIYSGWSAVKSIVVK